MAVVTTQGILLRSFAYGETSRILRFLTVDLGVVGVVARGARRQGAKGRSGLDTFTEGRLTLYHKDTRDLQTFKDFAAERRRRDLGGDVLRFAGASAMAELVLKHAGEESSPLLFQALSSGLDRLEEAAPCDLPGTILAQSWALVGVLGYGPSLDSCVGCGRSLTDETMARFDFSAGGLRCADCAADGGAPRVGPGARDQLRRLLSGRPPGDLTRPGAHLRLLSDFVTYHISAAGPLRSFGILAGFFPRGGED